MASFSLFFLTPFLVAFALWGSQQGQRRGWAMRLCLPAQALLGLLLAQAVWGTANHVAWIDICAASFVWLCVSVCLWWLRASSESDGSDIAGLFGLQGALWLCVLASTATGLVAGFCVAGVSLTVFLNVGGAGSERVFWFHRAADALAVTALLVWLLWPTDLVVAHIKAAQGNDDALLSPIAGLTASTWLWLLLSCALAFRGLAAAVACAAARAPVLAVVVALVISTFGFTRLFPAVNAVVLVLACVLGVCGAWALLRWRALGLVSLRLYNGVRLSGLFIAGINQWVFSTVLLQAPVVVVDACARLLKLLAGGDIQRYVAIGVAGLAALVFVATRPASPATLSIQVDGLTIRAVAARGALSSSRLLYDYDFDGDEQFDRVGVGPQAAFVYAVPGSYSVSVTIRDPFWHTSKTLRAKVNVRR